MKRQTLVLGTRNEKKRRELEELLSLPSLDLQTLALYPTAPEIEETGTTFLANASLKATTLARTLGKWVLGEDSGLCVDAIAGGPGIYSARYAGEPSDDERNNDKLLRELADTPDEKRTAYYVCTAALSDPKGNVRATAEGRCHGVIAWERLGNGGFGYDPLFLIPFEGKTFGELPAAFKQQISHRAQAMKDLRPKLVQLIESGEWI